MTQISDDLVNKIKQTKVLVIGDVLLDLYVRGDVNRISPEAPVPIILETSREYSLGGAGNVAHNIVAVGGKATLMGIIGNDNEGNIIRQISVKKSIVPKLICESGRHTPLKVRAVAGHHQLLRMDREYVQEMNETSKKKLFDMIRVFPDHHFIILSDYVKGFMTKDLVNSIKKRFGGERIIANIKPSSNIQNYKNIAVVTMNAKEGYDLTGIYGITDTSVTLALKRLADMFSASIVMTRGEGGLSIYDKKTKKVNHVSSSALHVFDVTGAGDTVVAMLGLLLGAGISLSDAAVVANRAAGVVVGMPGTAVLKPKDLKNILM